MKTKSTILSSILLSAMPALAGSPLEPPVTMPAAPSAWSCAVTLYGWMQSLDGDAEVRGVKVPVDVGFDDILEHLDIALMGAVEIDRGRWSFIADLAYAEVGADNSVPLGGQLDLTQQQFLGNFLAGYQVLGTDSMKFGVYAGARVNDINIDLEFSSLPAMNRSAGQTWVDPIIGSRFQADLSEEFFFRAVGDIGGFGVSSDFTWQAMAGFGYRVMDQGSILLGYRGIGSDYSHGDFTYDVVASGPVIGFEYKF